jgi:hypothetical protein
MSSLLRARIKSFTRSNLVFLEYSLAKDGSRFIRLSHATQEFGNSVFVLLLKRNGNFLVREVVRKRTDGQKARG